MAIIFGEKLEHRDRYVVALGEDITLIERVRDVYHHLDHNESEDLVVIGPDVDLIDSLDLSSKYRTLRPSLGVILVRRRLEVAQMNQAMRAGIREVVSTDDASALAAACQRSIELSRQMRLSDAPESGKKLAKVLIVFSAKGGCGKTTVSTNLAHVLAQRPNQRVCLVDFDLQFGDVGVALQIKPTKSMSDALAMEGSLDKSGVKSMLINYEEQLDVLLAPTNPADVEHISGDLAAAVLSELRSLYDYIVVDSPPAFTEVVLKTFDVADSFILLTTLDLPALKNLRVTIDTLDALGMPREKWNVVVNRSDAHQGLEVEDVENAIGMRVNALIPSSNDVPASINQGVTIVASKPRHPVSRAFAVLANQIFPTNEDPATKPATSWLGWVKRS